MYHISLKKILSIILCVFLCMFFYSELLANTPRVQDVFVDIDSNYKYLEELQQLYDRGMIVTDTSRRFNPDWLLDRDEFVGITMEVICEKCIQPQTQISFLQKYTDTQAYFDVDKINPYFYCIEEADDKNYVRWYGISVSCENGTSRVWERPFCPDNRILLEEAIAVLLRNSGIFTIEDNQIVTQNIRSGIITDSLAPDTQATDPSGEPYTFYGYLRKALEFQITEFDTAWNSQTLRLLELDSSGNINPKKFITREEFLRMAYIIFKSNNCIETSDAWFALAIDIWEKECRLWDEDCNLSNLDDPEDTYDFTPDVEWFCEEGITDPDGYFWRFYNTSNGQEFLRYGSYLDDIMLPSEWVWRIFLRVTDRCWNSSQVYSEIVSWDITAPPKDDTQIDVAIIIYDGWCTWLSANCEEIDFYEEWETGDIFDFEGRVSTTCSVGNITYNWTFTSPTNNQTLFRTWYIDNFEFLVPWEWLIVLVATDACGNTGREQETFIVRDPIRDNIGLSVDIIANPIYWYTNLLVDFEAIIDGWVGPFIYSWDFWTGDTNVWRIIDYIYTQEWIYTVRLIVTDSEWRTGEATVIIQVLDRDRCLQDSDGDGINDCDDLCLTIVGPIQNKWCPIFERICDADCGCPDWYECSDTNPLTCGSWFCRPITIPQSCLFAPSVGAIFWNTLCNSCPCSIQFDFFSDMRRCDIVFPAITSPDARTIYSRWQAVIVPQ